MRGVRVSDIRTGGGLGCVDEGLIRKGSEAFLHVI